MIIFNFTIHIRFYQEHVQVHPDKAVITQLYINKRDIAGVRATTNPVNIYFA